MSKQRALPVLIGAAATAAALLAYGLQPRSAPVRPSPVRPAPAAQAFVPIQDGKTIDFSNGAPAVKDSAADKAAIDSAVKDMDEAAKGVTFPADAPQKK